MGPSSRCQLGRPILAASLPDIRPATRDPSRLFYRGWWEWPAYTRPSSFGRSLSGRRTWSTVQTRLLVPTSESDRPDANAVVRRPAFSGARPWPWASTRTCFHHTTSLLPLPGQGPAGWTLAVSPQFWSRPSQARPRCRRLRAEAVLERRGWLKVNRVE